MVVVVSLADDLWIVMKMSRLFSSGIEIFRRLNVYNRDSARLQKQQQIARIYWAPIPLKLYQNSLQFIRFFDPRKSNDGALNYMKLDEFLWRKMPYESQPNRLAM